MTTVSHTRPPGKRLTPTQIVRRRRARSARQAEARQRRRFWGVLFGLAFGIGIVLPGGVAVAAGIGVYAAAVRALPPADLDLVAGLQSLAGGEDRAAIFYDAGETRIIDRARDPLAVTGAWTPLGTLPPAVIVAALQAEDPDFLTTTHFDPAGTLIDLAITALIAPPPPNSSITARLARAAVLGNDALQMGREADRSLEIALVAEMQRRYTPEQLLEWRLNTAHYGGEVYGIAAAAETYFGVRPVDLTLAQAAILAAIPAAPQYNPVSSEVAARGRGRDVLIALRDADAISLAAYDQAAADMPAFNRATGIAAADAIAPEYMAYARRQAQTVLDGLGLEGAALMGRGGLRVVTALDLDLYAQAECTLRSRAAALDGAGQAVSSPVTVDGSPCEAAALLPPLSPDAVLGAGQPRPDAGSVVVLDARTGVLAALAGPAITPDYQPAGTLLPFVYFEGLNGGLGGLYTPARMMLDIPAQFPGSEDGLIYTVGNLDARFRGPVSTRTALGAGLLPPAADVAYRQGISTILRTAHQMGITSMDENAFDLMLLERGGAASPLDLAYAYSVFAALGDLRGVSVPPAASGYRGRDPVAVLRIEDADGRVIWSYDADGAAACRALEVCTPLLERGLAYVINDVLADAETRRAVFGSAANPLEIARPAAVVNAVSADAVDNWTVGYTPQYVVAVHMSRADRDPFVLPPLAFDAAASVWHAVMRYAHTRDGLPVTGWPRPENIVEARVCDISGLAPNGICPTRTEIFLAGTERLPVDTYWQAVTINNETGQLATVNTPAGLRTEARFFVPPPEALDWWTANNQPLPPTEIDTVSVPQAVSAAQITTPDNYSYVGGEVEIAGRITAPDLRTYQIAYGEGLNPAAWITLAEGTTVPRPGEALATWDTTGLDGLYTLRLLLTRANNRVDSTTALVTVDNVPPTLILTTGEAGRVYRFPVDTTLPIVAEAADNLQVRQVDFYQDGVFLGADTSWPYSFDWDIPRPGTFIFRAVVADAVGGVAETEFTVEVLRSGG